MQECVLFTENNLAVLENKAHIGMILVLIMPCPFTGTKMFCASPNTLSQPKNLTAFSILLENFCAGTKTNFTECKSSFCLSQNICDCQNT